MTTRVPNARWGAPRLLSVSSVLSAAATNVRRWFGRPGARTQVLTAFLFAAVPRVVSSGYFITADEGLWMQRSFDYSNAVANLDPARMTATTDDVATMPGIATMWIGSLARLVWGTGAHMFGIWRPDVSFEMNPEALGVAQVVAGLTNAALVAIIFWCLWHCWSPLVAWIAVALLATEPWLIGLGSVLHTDALAGLFATAGSLCLCWAMGWPDASRRSHRPHLLAVLAGALLAMAPLTKLSAAGLAFLPMLLATFAVSVAWWRNRGDARGPVTRAMTVVLIAAMTAVAIVPLSWPALLTDFSEQWGLIQESAALGTLPHLNFFRGKATPTPGWYFYAYATPFRLTPWALGALVIGVPLALVYRATRWMAVAFCLGVLPVCWVLSNALKQFDRYIVIALIPVVVVAAMGLGPTIERVRARFDRRVGIGVLIGMMAYALWVAPYGLQYYNPVLGGGEVAEDRLLIGWSEGMELAAESIRDLEGGSCEGLAVLNAGVYDFFDFPCLTPVTDGERPDYIVVHVNRRQRGLAPSAALEGREIVGRVVIRGIEFVTIWR